MEKPFINFSFKALVTRFRAGSEEGLSVETLWRIVLGGILLGVCVIAVFAYITYGWALSIETPKTTSSKTRDAFSIVELQSVIAAYQNKEALTKQLLESAPRAPEYRKGRGPVATGTSASSPTPIDEPLPLSPTAPGPIN